MSGMRRRSVTYSIFFHAVIIIPLISSSSLINPLALGWENICIALLIVLALYVVQSQILIMIVTPFLLLNLNRLVNIVIVEVPAVLPLNPQQEGGGISGERNYNRVG